MWLAKLKRYDSLKVTKVAIAMVADCLGSSMVGLPFLSSQVRLIFEV